MGPKTLLQLLRPLCQSIANLVHDEHSGASGLSALVAWMTYGSEHGSECMALRRHCLAVRSLAATLGRRSLAAEMEPAAKAPRVGADGPTLTAYSMAGAVLWGPAKAHKGMTVAELASMLDRPSTSPGLKILGSG